VDFILKSQVTVTFEKANFYVSTFTLIPNGILMFGFSKLRDNVLALGEEADYEALNCLPALNLIRSTKLHLRPEPAFLPNACYKPFLFLSTNPYVATFK
jgi:hypothetical protein